MVCCNETVVRAKLRTTITAQVGAVARLARPVTKTPTVDGAWKLAV